MSFYENTFGITGLFWVESIRHQWFLQKKGKWWGSIKCVMRKGQNRSNEGKRNQRDYLFAHMSYWCREVSWRKCYQQQRGYTAGIKWLTPSYWNTDLILVSCWLCAFQNALFIRKWGKKFFGMTTRPFGLQNFQHFFKPPDSMHWMGWLFLETFWIIHSDSFYLLIPFAHHSPKWTISNGSGLYCVLPPPIVTLFYTENKTIWIE